MIYKPSLANLAILLRTPSRWPHGFVWNHLHPHFNPVGLVFRTWGGPANYDDSNDNYLVDLRKILGCDYETCERLLMTHLPTGLKFYKAWPASTVTPEMVANALVSGLRSGARAVKEANTAQSPRATTT